MKVFTTSWGIRGTVTLTSLDQRKRGVRGTVTLTSLDQRKRALSIFAMLGGC